MSEQLACTLCGAGGHTAAHCNWNAPGLSSQQGEQVMCETMERPKAECGCPDCGSSLIDMPTEQAEGAQGEREAARKALSPENQRVVPVEPLLAETHPLAALAHPSPVYDPKRCLACGGDHGNSGLPCPNMRVTAHAQPSPAPELDDELQLLRSVLNGYQPSIARNDGLRAIGEVERIVGALRAEVADAKARQEHAESVGDNLANALEATQARVAELIAALERAATAMWNSEANMDNAAAEAEESIGNAKSGAPVAKAGQVPEGFALVPDHPNADAIVTSLYRRFKDWSSRGFGPEDVTWCEVKADLLALVTQAGQVPEEWQPMQTAPKDGSLIRLLVNFEGMGIDDGDGPFATIGQNNLGNYGEDRWQIVGWCWEHDHFTDGKGTPVGWLPMLAAAPAQGSE